MGRRGLYCISIFEIRDWLCAGWGWLYNGQGKGGVDMPTQRSFLSAVIQSIRCYPIGTLKPFGG